MIRENAITYVANRIRGPLAPIRTNPCICSRPVTIQRSPLDLNHSGLHYLLLSGRIPGYLRVLEWNCKNVNLKININELGGPWGMRKWWTFFVNFQKESCYYVIFRQISEIIKKSFRKCVSNYTFEWFFRQAYLW